MGSSALCRVEEVLTACWYGWQKGGVVWCRGRSPWWRLLQRFGKGRRRRPRRP